MADTTTTIIGAGFTGVALATELAAHAVPGHRVRLVGDAPTYGRGVAYGEARHEHLLNVRARDLGLSADAPEDFADWFSLGERGRIGFLPRVVYGEYLAAKVQALTTVERIEAEVIAVERGQRGFRLTLADGSVSHSDRVVLALGALPPQPLGGVGPRLAVHPSYIGWPWQDGAIDRIPPDARLLIVGTGLTMGDVVATLRRRGHRGGVTALSRHGLLPRRHLDVPSPSVQLPPAVLHAIERADLRALVASLRSLSTVIGDWRSLIDALRPVLQPLWRTLPDAERARFLRHLRPYWETVRHRIAPQLAAELDQMQISGQLRVRAGRLLRARRTPDGIEAVIRERGAAEARVEHYDILVRATGLDTDVERTTHPLVSQLRGAELLSADPHGLGLRTRADGTVIDPRGHDVAGLHAIGPLQRGRLWEITAVPELRVAARALAATLAEQVRGRTDTSSLRPAARRTRRR